jgi:hypothetical protein
MQKSKVNDLKSAILNTWTLRPHHLGRKRFFVNGKKYQLTKINK